MTMGPFTVGQVPGRPQVFILFDKDGNQLDLTGYETIHAKMSLPDGTVSTVGTCSLPDPVNNPGKVMLTWPGASPFTVAGIYGMQLEFVGPGTVDDFSTVDDFAVEPVAGTSIPMWATPADVRAITGKNVTDDELARAQVIIDLVTNRTPEVSGSVLARDKIWLKSALCYQAVWMQAHPDVFERMAVGGISQDNVSSTFTSKAAIYLGPLAMRALKNVSWMRSKSLRITTPFIDREGIGGNPMIDDSMWNWSPMSMAGGEPGEATFGTPGGAM